MPPPNSETWRRHCPLIMLQKQIVRNPYQTYEAIIFSLHEVLQPNGKNDKTTEKNEKTNQVLKKNI